MYFYVRYMLAYQTENGKRKPTRFSLIRLPSAHRANIVCPFVDEGKNGSYPLANGLNGLDHLCLNVFIARII